MKLVMSLAAVVVAGIFAGLQLKTLPLKLQYPGELDLVEGMPLAEMIHLQQGIPIYAPASSYGYDAVNFGPFYYLLGEQLVNPAQPAYLPLRVLSLVGLLGCATGCGLLSFWLTRKHLSAILSVLLFLSYAFVIRHGISARPDAVALSLMFAGFLVAYRFRGRTAMLWAAPLMLFGFYYKQQFVAGPLAVLIYLVLEKRYRLAAQFATVLILGGLALLGLFQFVIFRGQDFFLHFITYNILMFAKLNLAAGILFFGLVLFIPILVALEFVRASRDKLLGYYLMGSIALSLMTVARSGSDSYYFLEPALIASCLFGSLFAERTADPPRAMELLVLMVVSLFLGQWGRGEAPSPQAFKQDQAVQEFYRRRFLRGTMGLSYYVGDMIRSGLSTPIPNVYHYTFLVRRGTLSDEYLIQMVRNHGFGVVVLGFDPQAEEGTIWAEHWLTKPMRDAIRAEYQVADKLTMPRPESIRHPAWLYICVPRTAPRAEMSHQE
ncbi:MAG: hypothetical protein HY508_10635 [Acidobacteria bacterium]|nr:hypothetical protein [Acidobacteriota bacterium]